MIITIVIITIVILPAGSYEDNIATGWKTDEIIINPLNVILCQSMPTTRVLAASSAVKCVCLFRPRRSIPFFFSFLNNSKYTLCLRTHCPDGVNRYCFGTGSNRSVMKIEKHTTPRLNQFFIVFQNVIISKIALVNITSTGWGYIAS